LRIQCIRKLWSGLSSRDGECARYAITFRDGGRSNRDEDKEATAKERKIDLRGRRDSGGFGISSFTEVGVVEVELAGVRVVVTSDGEGGL
jgi:hypothetical protein